MPKIIEYPKIKRIECKFCGCKYEFSDGDILNVVVTQAERMINGELQSQKLFATLNCPTCNSPNKVEFIKDVNNV